MDAKQNPLFRQLSHLKVLSRLLGHELHAQGASRTIALSRDQVIEIQTTLDLFIEEASRRTGSTSMARDAGILPTAGETRIVPTRN